MQKILRIFPLIKGTTFGHKLLAVLFGCLLSLMVSLFFMPFTFVSGLASVPVLLWSFLPVIAWMSYVVADATEEV
jgi:hypothetical protein